MRLNMLNSYCLSALTWTGNVIGIAQRSVCQEAPGVFLSEVVGQVRLRRVAPLGKQRLEVGPVVVETFGSRETPLKVTLH
jgi:hypothetical protein